MVESDEERKYSFQRPNSQVTEKFSSQLGDADFKRNDGWISRFKNSRNISLGKISGEANSVNCADVRNCSVTAETIQNC